MEFLRKFIYNAIRLFHLVSISFKKAINKLFPESSSTANRPMRLNSETINENNRHHLEEHIRERARQGNTVSVYFRKKEVS